MNAVAFMLASLRADENVAPALRAAFDKIDPRRFASEPVPHSALAELDDACDEEDWAEAKRYYAREIDDDDRRAGIES